MNKSYIPVLDSLRAIAAISVCLYHFVCTTTGYIQNQLVLDFFSTGKHGVQLFFVISGFVIPWAMYNAGYQMKYFFQFLLKRLARLEPPYVISIIITVSLLMFRDYINWGEPVSYSTNQVMLHFGYLIPFFENYSWLNQVYWTLAIEFQYYIFIALIYLPLIKSNVYVRTIIYLGIMSSSLLTNSGFLPYWLSIFFFGILLFLYKSKTIKQVEYFIFTLLNLAYCLYFYSLFDVIYSIIPVLAILYFPKLQVYKLHFVGRYSYSIYLMHGIIGSMSINVLSHYITSSLGSVLVITFGLIITLIGAYLSYIVVEKPSKKFSSSIKYK